jgi:hypothetical protein
MRAVAFLRLGCGSCWGQTTDECKKVRVRVGKDFEMAKGDDGGWSATTTPPEVLEAAPGARGNP